MGHENLPVILLFSRAFVQFENRNAHMYVVLNYPLGHKLLKFLFQYFVIFALQVLGV